MISCTGRKKSKEELYRSLTKKKNRDMEHVFSMVPFGERLIFVPHCLRNTEKCRAKEQGNHYLCVECGGCKIGAIHKKARDLGYRELYILKGGRAIEKITAETRPGAIVGIACYFEGAQGMEQSEKNNITVQFIPLSRDGCVNTDVDLDEVFLIISKHAPA